MRILACSDLHGDITALERIIGQANKADMVVVAGDLTEWPMEKNAFEFEVGPVKKQLSKALKLDIREGLLRGKVEVRRKGDDIRVSFPKAIGKRLSAKTIEHLDKGLLLKIGALSYQFNQLFEVLQALDSVERPSAIVLGNEDHPDLGGLIKYVQKKHRPRFRHIDKEFTKHGDCNFFGYGGAVMKDVRSPNDWEEETCRQEMKPFLSYLRRANPLVMVSHCPPFDCLDFSVKYGARPIGSEVLREVVEEVKPRYFVCGHSHLSGGRVEQLGDTLVVNVAAAQVHPRYGGRYAIIDTDRSSVDWFRLTDFYLR